MSTTQSDLLKLQNGTEETQENNSNSPSELVERENVEGTGFEIIGNKEKGYFIALGPYRLTQPRKSKGECRKMIASRDYELILGLMGATIQANEKEKKFSAEDQDRAQFILNAKNKPKQTLEEKETDSRRERNMQ